MDILQGVQSNCSEMVYQICGVTSSIAEEMRKSLIEELSTKYTKEYLETYTKTLLDVPGKYCLNLYEIDGEQTEDQETIRKIADKMGLKYEVVGFCSEPLTEDKQMEWYVKRRDECQ